MSINHGVNLLNTKTVLNCVPTGCKHMKTDEEVEEVFNILERRLYDDPSKVRGYRDGYFVYLDMVLFTMVGC